MTLLAPAAAGALLFVWFLSIENRRRPEIVVFLAVGLTLVDSLVYPGQARVPIGLFRPSIAGQDIRLVDVIVPTALAARLLVRGLPRRVTAEGLVWTIFFAWYAFAAVVGLARRQPFDLILFQGKFILHTGGMMAVVAGVPIERLADRTMLERVGRWIGLPALMILPLAAANIELAVPGLRGAQIGRIAPDAATILVVLGMLVLVGTANRGPISLPTLIGGLAMVGASFVADQRALLVGMIPALLVLALAVSGRTWRHRSPVRIAALLPFAAALLVPILLGIMRAAESGESLSSTPVIGTFDETFASQAKRESADIRIELVRDGRRLALDEPLLGNGLGQQTAIIRGRSGDESLIADFHNVIVDLAVRGGIPAVALFVLALALTFTGAFRRWRELARDAHALLVLAAGAALASLVVKGLFETIFQKYRLAALMGMLLGIIAAAENAPMRPRSTVGDREDRAWI